MISRLLFTVVVVTTVITLVVTIVVATTVGTAVVFDAAVAVTITVVA